MPGSGWCRNSLHMCAHDQSGGIVEAVCTAGGRRRRNSGDGYLAEASGRGLSPMQPRTPDSSAAAASGLNSGQVMGLEGLMYGSPTYVSRAQVGR